MSQTELQDRTILDVTGNPAADQPIAEREAGDVAPMPASNDPMAMISRHIDRGGSMEQLERLLELQKNWEKHQARKAFNAAMAAFAANPPHISKNKTVDFETSKGRTTYDHATLDEITQKVAAAMAPHGLSFRWDTDNSSDPMRVTCIVSHRDGHREHTTLYGPTDNSGNKNTLQAIGSGITYLERYTLKAALGLAESDQDDDGNSATPKRNGNAQAGGPDRITAEQAQIIRERLSATDSHENGFLISMKRHTGGKRPPRSIEDLPAVAFDTALSVIDDNAARRG